MPARQRAIPIAGALTMLLIVYPDTRPTKTAAIIMESEIVEKRVVHEQSLRQPTDGPSPVLRTQQSCESRQKPGQVCNRSEQVTEPTSFSVSQRRIVSFGRSTPYRVRIVVRYIHPLRIRRLNFNRPLLPLRFQVDRELRRAHQLPTSPRLRPQILDRIHHVRLLGEKRIPHVRGPSNIAIEPRDHIRKSHQRLHTGIPILLLGRRHQLPVTQIPVLL